MAKKERVTRKGAPKGEQADVPPPAPPASGDAVVEYTTLRFYAADGEDIADLANRVGGTIAAVYRELCAPIVRKRLIELTKQRLQNLEQAEGE